MSKIDEIKKRLSEASDREPECWDSETRSYYYPKWNEFTRNAEGDIAHLLATVEKLKAALESVVDWESYVINNSMPAREVLYEACETARQALREIADE